RTGSATLSVPAAAPKTGIVAWSVFSREQTDDLLARARQQQVSVNSLLLFALGQACGSLWNRRSRFSRWMIPINMRGVTRGPRDTATHVAYVRIHLSSNASAQSVHEQFRSHIAGNEHWWLWLCYRYGSFLGPAIMRLMARADLRFGNS